MTPEQARAQLFQMLRREIDEPDASDRRIVERLGQPDDWMTNRLWHHRRNRTGPTKE